MPGLISTASGLHNCVGRLAISGKPSLVLGVYDKIGKRRPASGPGRRNRLPHQGKYSTGLRDLVFRSAHSWRFCSAFAEGDERIDAAGPSRREIAGQQSDSHEDDGGGGDAERIVGADAKEHAAEQLFDE